MYILPSSCAQRRHDSSSSFQSPRFRLWFCGQNVCHVEALLHGFPVPAVVTGRTHMSAVHAGSFVVIGGYCLVLRQVGVGQELVCTAFTLHQFFGNEFPGYPVGYL